MGSSRALRDNDEEPGLGGRVASERQALGMSQTLLARLSGMERDHVNKVEHGRRQLRAEEAIRVAAVLGLTVADLSPNVDQIRFRERAVGPEAESAIALFNEYIANCELIEQLKDFDAQ